MNEVSSKKEFLQLDVFFNNLRETYPTAYSWWQNIKAAVITQDNMEYQSYITQQLNTEFLPILEQSILMLRNYKREDTIILLSKLKAKLQKAA
jgi:hypothetical protein